MTTPQLPAHAAYQSAVRPSSMSSRWAPASSNVSATDASLYADPEFRTVALVSRNHAMVPLHGGWAIGPS